VGPGVEVDIEDGQVSVEVYLIAKREVDLLQMGRQLQGEITRAIEDIVGMPVRAVNVHIEDTATELVPPLPSPSQDTDLHQARAQWGEATAR
jgi:uncharacterized alkaline shock family protein YloU